MIDASSRWRGVLHFLCAAVLVVGNLGRIFSLEVQLTAEVSLLDGCAWVVKRIEANILVVQLLQEFLRAY